MIYNTTFRELQSLFPKGIEIGIKQPYLLITYEGIFTMRNDNPQNIVINSRLPNFDLSVTNPDNLGIIEDLLKKGNKFLEKEDYISSMSFFSNALKIINKETNEE